MKKKYAILKIWKRSYASKACLKKEIAYTLHNKRREIGKVYKEAAPPLLQEYIYVATANKYGDPLGPTFEQLAERKTYAEIIESSSRPIEDLDNRLTVDGFVEWYRKKKSE